MLILYLNTSMGFAVVAEDVVRDLPAALATMFHRLGFHDALKHISILRAKATHGKVPFWLRLLMASFTLNGMTFEYLKPAPDRPSEVCRSWTHGQYPKVMAALPLG